MAATVAGLPQAPNQGKQQAGSASDRSLRSVFVGNIPYEASEEQLKEIFSEVGPVVSFRLVFDRETGKPKGYGFCEYKDQETALSAMRNLNGYELNGRALRVDSAASEKNREEMKGIEGSSRPEANPYGPTVPPEEAPEAITQAVASLPPEQMFELMKQMKICIQNNPEEARQMLLQNPQLAYALLQAQVVMKIVDPVIAQGILHRPADPVVPMQPTATQQPPPLMGSGPNNQGPSGPFQSGPGPAPEMRGPPDIRGPSDMRGPPDMRGPGDMRGPPDMRGPGDMRGPPDMRGPQDMRGPGPEGRGPLDMRGMPPDMRGPPDRGPVDMRGPPNRGPGDMRGPPDRGPGDMRGPPDRGPGDMRGPLDRGPGDMRGLPDRGPGDMRGPPDRGPGDMRGPPDRGPGDMRGHPDRGPGDMRGPPDRGSGDMRGPPDRGPGEIRSLLGDMHGPGPGPDPRDFRGPHPNGSRMPPDMRGPDARGPQGPDFRGPPQDQFGDPRDRRMSFDPRDPRNREPPRDDRRGPSGDPRDQPRDPRGPPPDQRFGAGGPRDPRAERGPPGPQSDGRFSGPTHSPQQQWAPNQGGPPPRGPPGFNPPQAGPVPQGADVTAQDQEKAALIMQVLSLTDQQISLLPADQRQSIMVLKEQIAHSTQPN